MSEAATGLSDGAAFDRLVLRHRRELQVHCYRMLASYDDAEEAVQEVFVRAWRHHSDLVAEDEARPWLYRIATNVCLDQLRARGRRPVDLRSFAEVAWLQPYPDIGLDGAADERLVERETVELTFIAALQALPARQRAVLIARDVMGWPAADTADHLGTSVAAANSALQRARSTLQEHLPERRADWTRPAMAEAERALLDRFIDAHQRCDAEAALAIAAEDIRVTMPPAPMCFDGLAQLAPLLERAFGPDREGDWRLLPTATNRMPAAASYLRRPGDTRFRAYKLDVLRTDGTVILELTTFGPSLFPGLGLPAELDA